MVFKGTHISGGLSILFWNSNVRCVNQKSVRFYSVIFVGRNDNNITFLFPFWYRELT